MFNHNYYVYIMTNNYNKVLYIGVTNDLERRVYEHQNPSKNSTAFTAQYNVQKLVYFEHFIEIQEAIAREKQLKGKSRAKKIALIQKENPKWLNLAVAWFS